MLLQIAYGQPRNLDLASGRRRMDEAVVSKIDADVRKREAARIEKHEIARCQIRAGDLVAEAAQLLRRTWQRDAGDLLEDVAHEAAAVDAALRRLTAKAIVDADETQRVD